MKNTRGGQPIPDAVRVAMCMEAYASVVGHLGALIGTLQTPRGGTFDAASARSVAIIGRVEADISRDLRETGRGGRQFDADSLAFMLPIMLRAMLDEIEEGGK